MGRSLAAGAPPNFRATATCRHRFPLGYGENQIGQVLPEGAESGRSDQLAEEPPRLPRELTPSGSASCANEQRFDPIWAVWALALMGAAVAMPGRRGRDAADLRSGALKLTV